MAIYLERKSLEISTGNIFAVLNKIMQSSKTDSMEWGTSEENRGHKAAIFMKPEGRLSRSKDIANDSYERSHETRPSPHIPHLLRCIIVLRSYPSLGLASEFFSSGLHTSIVQAVLIPAMPAT
jgi:hypothetical protein